MLLRILHLFYTKLNIIPSKELKINTVPSLELVQIQQKQQLLFISYNFFKTLLKKKKNNLLYTLLFQKINNLLHFTTKTIILKGVGYRFEIKQTKKMKLTFLKLKLGYTKPIIIRFTKNIFVRSPKHKMFRLVVRSRQLLTVYKFAQFIKNLRIPDVYKNKGVCFRREKLRKKPIIKQQQK